MPRLCSILLLSLLIAFPAAASPITLVFHGTVSVSFVGGISAGESFAATLLYDDAAAFNCSDVNNCFYPAISLRIDYQGGASTLDDAVSVHVQTGNSSSPEDVFTTGSSSTSIVFDDPQGAALPGAASIPTLAELNSPGWNTRRLSYTSPIAQPLQGDVFLVTPEPSTGLLVVAGLLGVAGYRRERVRRGAFCA